MEVGDPSAVMGYQELFQRLVPIELRPALGEALSVDEAGNGGAAEHIRLRVLARVTHGVTTSVRLELSHDQNLFFHYQHTMTPAVFGQLQVSQQLMVGFDNYPAMLARLVDQVVSQPANYMALLLLQPDGSARLEFIQNMEYKYVALLSVSCAAVPEVLVRSYASARYEMLQGELGLVRAQLDQLSALVRQKCPSILLQLQKAFPNKFPLSSSSALAASAGEGSSPSAAYGRPASPAGLQAGALGGFSSSNSPGRPLGPKTPARAAPSARSWMV